jgi:hypothetical protein
MARESGGGSTKRRDGSLNGRSWRSFRDYERNARDESDVSTVDIACATF